MRDDCTAQLKKLMQERILVLDGGEVIENGTHAELVERRGLYAELFNLQAEGYR